MSGETIERGVSPTMGIILLVGITVILSVTVGTVVLEVADPQQDSSSGGIRFDTKADGIHVTLITSGGSDIDVQLNGSTVHTFNSSDIGDTVIIGGLSSGDRVTAVTNGSSKQVVASKEIRGNVGGSGVTISSGSNGGGGGGGSGTLVESFEDGSLSNYGGSLSKAQIVSNYSTDGSKSLQFIQKSDGSDQFVSAASGLDAYPEHGDTIRYEFKTTGDRDRPIFAWAVNTSGDANYYARLNGDGKILVYRGNNKIVDDTFTGLSADTEYLVDVDFNDTTTVTLRASDGTKIDEKSFTDSTFTSGGVGFGARVDTNVQQNTTVYFDNIRILP